MRFQENFTAHYGCDVLSELPSSSDRRFYFPGAVAQGGRDGVIIRVVPAEGEEWVGVFAFGEVSRNGVTAVFSMPNPSQVCVVARGQGYIVDVDGPREREVISMVPILGAVPVPARGILVLHDFTRVRAYGADGLVWSTPSLSWDGLKIVEATDEVIHGTAWDAARGQDVPFTIDLKTGDHEGGASPELEQVSTPQ